MVTALVPLAALAVGGGWKPIESDPGGFKVTMPGEVKRVSETVKLGELKLKRTVLGSIDEGRRFEVSFIDLPQTITVNTASNDILDAAREGARTTPKTLITNIKRTKVGGYPAQRFKVMIPKVGLVNHQVILWENRLCHQVVVAPRSEDADIAADRFFKSFKIGAPETDKQPKD
jgi:hypothetical protein